MRRMTAPTVTALYAALNAMLNIALAARVSLLRRDARVSIGTGESRELLVAVRVHANNAEFVPLALVLLLVAEACGGASLWLHVAGGTLLVARLAHAVGMPLPAPNVFRASGTGLTWTLTVALAGYALYLRAG